MSPQCVAQLLRHLPKSDDPRLIVGPSSLDDAGVLRFDDDTAIVQTVDLFSPNVDDPFDFGRIVAANCLSDAYAMGARPLTVMNIVCFPASLDMSILGEIIKGGSEIIRESGAVLMGGHSMFDTEVKYGLAVTALARPEDVLTNAAARPGDLLVLTKPIGTGLIGGAVKNENAPPELVARAVPIMTRLNRYAAEAMQAVGVRACTDVTGFGLLGHACEVARSSNATLRIRAGSVPLIDGIMELAKTESFLAGLVNNREYAREWTRIDDGVGPVMFEILTDAQTSGGLLAAVAPEKADELLERLADAGDEASAVIGEVIERDDCHIELAP